MHDDELADEERRQDKCFCKRMSPRQYWVSPGKSSLLNSHEHRKVTWFELMFDLLFVVTLSKLGKVFITKAMTRDIPGTAVQDYVALFFPTYGVWLPIARFLNWFDMEDLYSTCFQLINIVLMMGLNLNIEHCLNYGDDYDCPMYPAFLGALHVNLLVAYIYAYVFAPQYRSFLAFGIVYTSVKALLWFAVIFTVQNWQLLMFWWTALALDMLETFFRGCLLKLSSFVHIPLNLDLDRERHGLFFILALGEIIIGVLRVGVNFESHVPDAYIYGVAIFGIVLAVIFKISYFDVADNMANVTHALRYHTRSGRLWTLMHLPLNACVAICGAILEYIIEEGHAHHKERLALCVACLCTSVTLLAIQLLHHERHPQRQKIRRSRRFVFRLVCITCIGLLSLWDSLPDWLFFILVGVCSAAPLVPEIIGGRTVRVPFVASEGGDHHHVAAPASDGPRSRTASRYLSINVPPVDSGNASDLHTPLAPMEMQESSGNEVIPAPGESSHAGRRSRVSFASTGASASDEENGINPGDVVNLPADSLLRRPTINSPNAPDV